MLQGYKGFILTWKVKDEEYNPELADCIFLLVPTCFPGHQMSWIHESKLTWFQSFCVNVLKTGAIPKHVAFIMDGNRRFAQKYKIERAQGHVKGFEKLAETLQWCRHLGIKEVTVYAFSIENFKRSKDEVDGLMDLLREKFESFVREKDKIMEYGICIRVLGNVFLLPKDIQKRIADAVLLTRDNKKAFINVCISYTSREEICHAVKEMAIGAEKGLIEPEDISEDVLEKCLYSSECTHPDLVIRTSGEVRLSDFLLWQSAYSVLAFIEVLWPEFTIWRLFSAILYYQMNCKKPQEYKENAQREAQHRQDELDRQCALMEVNLKHPSLEISEEDILSEMKEIRIRREKRIKQFLDYVSDNRFQTLNELVSDESIVT